jgi:hypothetical protein
VHLDEWWGQPVNLDFHFFHPEEMADSLRIVGFKVEEIVESGPTWTWSIRVEGSTSSQRSQDQLLARKAERMWDRSERWVWHPQFISGLARIRKPLQLIRQPVSSHCRPMTSRRGRDCFLSNRQVRERCDLGIENLVRGLA